MDNLEPITRNEMFLNGDDLEPITREEMILAGADLEPITRHEWFLKKYRGGGGGGGYDLVNIPDLPADIASFNDGTDLPMASLKVTVTPYQDLSHGDPSPENICPIIGWDEAVVTVADDAESPTTSHEYTIDLDGTRYGGTLDVVSGVLTVTHGYVDLGDLNWGASSTESRFYANAPSLSYKMATDTNFICSQYIDDGIGSSTTGYYGDNGTVRHNYTAKPNPSAYEIYIHDDRFGKDATAFKTAMNGVQLVYELATPITVQLAPTPVKSLEGTNKIFANCGQITEGKYFKRA